MTTRNEHRAHLMLAVSMVILALSQALMAWTLSNPWAWAAAGAAGVAAVATALRVRRLDPSRTQRPGK